MDMLKFAGSTFLKPADVERGPFKATIVAVEVGQFDKPVATFSDGTKLSLNATNTRALCRAYGSEDTAWIGQEVELFLGQLEYQGRLHDSVLVRPVLSVIEKNAPPKPRKEPGGDMDDEIPF
jgi:hypothetical protein